VTGPVPILFDTDLGTDVDDAVALAFLANDPRCRLLGVTTVNGDTRARAALAQALLDLAGRSDVPVGVGASHPMTGARSKSMPVGLVATAPAADLPATMPTAEDVIVDVLRAATEPVHVCAVGAFTNIAMVLSAHPDLHASVAGVHLMGGCLDSFALVPGGERSPAIPEFNLNGDPVAAAVVLALPVPLRIAPLDVTNELLFTDDDRAAIARSGPLGAVLEEQMAGWIELLRSRSTNPDVAHVRLHDPLTVVGAVNPDVEETAERRVSMRGGAGRAFFVESAVGRIVDVVHRVDASRLRAELVSAL
jgi:inosine-uridine nucleoside N-ribohydrolase